MLRNINATGAPVYFTGTESRSALGQEDAETEEPTPQLAVEPSKQTVRLKWMRGARCLTFCGVPAIQHSLTEDI